MSSLNDALLLRIAEALERMAPRQEETPSLTGADAFVWHPGPPARLAPVPRVSRVDLVLLKGIDRQKEILLTNRAYTEEEQAQAAEGVITLDGYQVIIAECQ